MSWKLFLDDIRYPSWVGLNNNEFVVARTFDEAVQLIQKHGAPEHIAFDHDLEEDHYRGVFARGKTGMDLAKWVVDKDMDDNGKFLPDNFSFSVHSMNPIGAQNIRSYMEGWLLNKPLW